MNLSKLIKTKKTVFRSREIGTILGLDNDNYLKVVIKRAKEKGEIKNISKGLYSLTEDYNFFELANKVKSPSYVSLETVLQREGLIFQDYSGAVFSVSNNFVTKNIEDIKLRYFKIKDQVLSDMIGIKRRGGYLIASKERALCDKLYLSSGFYFDNLEGVDWEKVSEIMKIYNNKRLINEILALKNSLNIKNKNV